MKLAVKMVGYIIKEMELIYEKKPIKNEASCMFVGKFLKI